MPRLLLSLLLTSLLIAQSVWAAVDMVAETEHRGNSLQDHSSGHQHGKSGLAAGVKDLVAEGSLLAESSLLADASLPADGTLSADDSSLAEGSLPADGLDTAEHDHSCFCSGHVKDLILALSFDFPMARHDLLLNHARQAPRQRAEALLRPPLLSV